MLKGTVHTPSTQPQQGKYLVFLINTLQEAKIRGRENLQILGDLRDISIIYNVKPHLDSEAIKNLNICGYLMIFKQLYGLL
jgi:hypothetical protein